MASRGPRIAALMPCYGWAPARELVLETGRHVESLLLVDDGMPAAPAAALDRLAGALGMDVLHLPHRGKGSAVAAGLRRLEERGGHDGVMLLDSDGQHPPAAIPRFVDASSRADLVIGNRFHDGVAGPWIRRTANRIANRAVARRVGREIPDSQCGMRLLTRRALEEVRVEPGRFESETVHLLRCLEAGVPVAWVPIPPIYDGAPSSFRPIRDSIAVLAACVRSTKTRAGGRLEPGVAPREGLPR